MLLLWSVSCVPFQNPKLTLETTVKYVTFYKWFSSGASSSNKSGIFFIQGFGMEDGPNMNGPGPWGPGGPPGSRNDGPDNGRPPPFGVDRCVTTFRYVGHFSKIEMSKHRYHRERERENL